MLHNPDSGFCAQAVSAPLMAGKQWDGIVVIPEPVQVHLATVQHPVRE